MKYSVTEFIISASDPVTTRAAELFSKELKKRTSLNVVITNEVTPCFVTFKTDETIDNKNLYIIESTNNGFEITAKTIRGLIFGYSHILRKAKFTSDGVIITEDIEGTFKPQKQIIGHQVGYRTTPNTYDAWDYNQYFDYYLDMMAFGTNTCEHNTTKFGKKEMNPLMRYTQEEFVVEASRLADTVDLDVSLWHANDDNETEEEALRIREDIYSKIPRINAVFPPGGDPGEMYADAFVERMNEKVKQLGLSDSAHFTNCVGIYEKDLSRGGL